jgi:hypothetical protein
MLAAVLAWQAFTLPGAAAGTQGGWSEPSSLRACAASAGPAIAFPSASPSIPTDPGAIVWTREQSCARSAALPASGGLQLVVSALGGGDDLARTSTQPSPSGSVTAPLAVGASFGRVAVAVPLRPGGPGVTILEGRAGTPLRTGLVLADAAEPYSLAHAYLGDAAIAAVIPGPAIEVRVERYFRSGFGPPMRIAIGPGRVSALSATMDYRADVLVAWQQGGVIYAHMLRASGRGEPTQLVGSSRPDPQLQALVSDNDHGMIAWSSTTAGAAARTRVHVALSGAGVRFAGSRLVASFPDPQRAGALRGSLALVRLSTENVMLAWTDFEGAHYVVRAVPAVFAGRRHSTRLSDPAAQSVLVGLAPGPAGEAVALWRSAQLPYGPSELWAAHATIHVLVGSRPAEMVAPAAVHVGARLAIDPGNDRAVAAWLAPGARPHVEYAVGPTASGYRPLAPSAAGTTHGGGAHRLRIALAVLAAVAVLAGLIATALRRRRGRPVGAGVSGRDRRRGR